MDLTSLYELRERLKAGAIAGTELVCEDFRLKRALEAFRPLEQASPVFAKIGQLAGAVTAPDCADRAAALLDAVSLVDAVLCTQGMVAVQGEMEPIPSAGGGTALTNAPYSILAVLLDALKNTGSGRYGTVLELHENHPELFSDYRVKAALVQALDASYAELADQVAEWLKEEGPSVVPLLKKDFNPKGKREMVRRVKVIEALSGAGENEFYLSQLEYAEREVKVALIYALRHTEDNAQKLLELVRSEKGNARNTARFALSFLQGEEVWDYWRDLAQKQPMEAAGYMATATAEAAGDLVAEALIKLLTPYAENGKKEPLKKENAEAIAQLLSVLPGKSGSAACTCYRVAAALSDALDRPAEGIKGEWVQVPYGVPGRHSETKFSQAVPALLQQALLIRPSQEMEELAKELYDSYGTAYLPAALTAKLLTENAVDVYQFVEALLEKKNLLGITKQLRECDEQVKLGLSSVYWEEKQKAFLLTTNQYGPVDGRPIRYAHQPAEPLDERFYDLLMRRGKKHMDGILARWIQPENRTLCEKLGKYFYDKALTSNEGTSYLNYLKACGWTDCTGIALHYCRSVKNVYTWGLIRFIGEMPGDAAARAEEAQRVCDELESGKMKLNVNLDQLKDCIVDLRKDIPV